MLPRRRSSSGRVTPATVWLATEAFEAMMAEAERAAPMETGGMLLGYRSDGGVVVQSITGPGPEAEHHRFSFVPDADWQQDELERIYVDSGRVTTYLGDWHTHPAAAAIPSRRDRKTARRVAREKAARAPTPVTAILGGEMDAVAALRVYEYVKQEREFVELSLSLFS